MSDTFGCYARGLGIISGFSQNKVAAVTELLLHFEVCNMYVLLENCWH